MRARSRAADSSHVVAPAVEQRRLPRAQHREEAVRQRAGAARGRASDRLPRDRARRSTARDRSWRQLHAAGDARRRSVACAPGRTTWQWRKRCWRRPASRTASRRRSTADRAAPVHARSAAAGRGDPGRSQGGRDQRDAAAPRIGRVSEQDSQRRARDVPDRLDRRQRRSRQLLLHAARPGRRRQRDRAELRVLARSALSRA